MVETLEAIRIVTRCTSRAQFIAMFSRYCTPSSCFIPSTDSRPIGTATVFSIRLADGTPLLRGEGVVLAAWSHADHAFKRPGIELGIHELDDACSDLFEALTRPRSMAVPISPKDQLQMLLAATPSVVSEVETPTVEMPPLALPEEPRAPSAPDILPANPLTEMTDDLLSVFVECNLLAEAVPIEVAGEPTQKNRDPIATILGVAPLQKQVYAAPQPVITELIDRVHTRAVTAPEPIANIEVTETSTDAVAITYAAPQAVALAMRRHVTPPDYPTRPRRRIRLASLGVVTQVVRGPTHSLGRLRRRVARAVTPALRRWWLPATVATTIVTAVAFVLV